MMYILEQRLQAQSIPNDKSRKGFHSLLVSVTTRAIAAGPRAPASVMQDIIRTMYNAKFMAELFKPQEVYSPSSTRQV